MELFPDQQAALEMTKTHPVCILTGAPGTGKTTVVKAVLDHFDRRGLRIAMGAPSGKAAKRLYECTGRRAYTIHKLLEPQKVGGSFVFTRDAENPIEADLIVLDEVSLLDVSLMARFLEAVKPGTRLILVGDSYQLPSVGPGNVLRDLIASGVIPATELTVIKRQDPGWIIQACHRIKNGQDIELANSKAKDFFFLKRDSEQEIRETLLDLVCRRLPQSYGADPFRDIQVITPLREKTDLSCAALNADFQERLIPGPLVGGSRFKVGDKLIQTRNDYKLDLINGDIGFVREIRPEARSLVVAFDNPSRLVEIPLFDNALELGYALTAHKFQGSECRIVVIPIHRSFGPMILQRSWIYTAVSRAKEVCILVGQRDEIPRIIRRNQQQRRFTRLAERLGGQGGNDG